MTKAEVFHLEVLCALRSYTTEKVDSLFQDLEKGDPRDIDYFNEIYRKRSYPCWFYWYLACAVKVLKATQAVELGADKGVSALMMASEGATVYSVDKKDGWEYVPKEYSKIVKIVGESTDMNLWKNIDLGKTDLWLIDATHTNEAVTKEYIEYKLFFKKGAVILFDDLDSIKEAWDQIQGDKMVSRDIHGEGVGILVI